ncbi:MAG: hypothetical protein A2Y14_02330 [Verrucomicrobia bacterium GWF2_51_19]|nr:MAG: hypothetical protein A2Y14_02330 [Verrucomicrobia bacterium GWF2_51_19]HCJ11907.1 hypothetical protein [Opitutae bacterium]
MKKLILLTCSTLLIGCSAIQQAVKEDNLTVGTVQREIAVGMPASAVAEVLGSPNIVTTDENHQEVWIYDKIRSEVSYSQRGGGIPLLMFGSAGDSTSSKKTLTIIIKFDITKKVRDFAYHASRF